MLRIAQIINGLMNFRFGCCYLFRHRDSLSIDERENLVVVHNGVHTLYPQCVNRSVEHNPLLI